MTRFRRSRKLQVGLIVIVLFTPMAIFLLRNPAKAVASWFDDSFAYRNSVAITSHTTAENNVYISATIDTSTSGQFQSDCGDLRFTTAGGDLLPYYISSGCATATTVIHVFFQSFPAGSQIIYYYYGNPTADNGFSSADFATEATGYVIGSTGSQEKGGAPVAYWKFDDGTGTNAQDSSPNNNDGTITGATWQTSDQCISEKCLYFDGTNDVVTVANSVAGVQTVSFWVRPITTTEQFVDLNGSAYIQASSGTVSATGFTSPTIYVDGKVSSTIVANKWQYISVTTATPITASAIKVGQISTNYGQAFFDDVKIYNYARTAAQVKADYASRGSSKGTSASLSSSGLTRGSTLSNGLVGYWKMDEASWSGAAGEVLDASGNGNNGQAAGNATTAAGKFGNGGTFDGTGDYINAGTNSAVLPNAWTVAAWVRPSNTTTNVLMSFMNSSAPTIALEWGGTGKPIIYMSANNFTYFDTSAWNTLKDGNWHHVAFSLPGNSVTDILSAKMYVDGVAVALGSNVATDAQNTKNMLLIGERGDGGGYYNGLMDSFRIYNRALSPKEVRDLYNWAPGPRVYLKMEEGSGTAANDDSGNARTGTLNGNPIWAPGKYGKGVKLDGTGDYVQVSDF